VRFDTVFHELGAWYIDLKGHTLHCSVIKKRKIKRKQDAETIIRATICFKLVKFFRRTLIMFMLCVNFLIKYIYMISIKYFIIYNLNILPAD